MKLHRYSLVIPCILASCSSIPDSSPGINVAERKILETYYYYKHSDHHSPSFDDEELAKLMDKSTDSTLDGAYAEAHSSSIALALAFVGDERFASVLSTRAPDVRYAVCNRVALTLKHSSLKYPKAEALLAQN